MTITERVISMYKRPVLVKRFRHVTESQMRLAVWAANITLVDYYNARHDWNIKLPIDEVFAKQCTPVFLAGHALIWNFVA